MAPEKDPEDVSLLSKDDMLRCLGRLGAALTRQAENYTLLILESIEGLITMEKCFGPHPETYEISLVSGHRRTTTVDALVDQRSPVSTYKIRGALKDHRHVYGVSAAYYVEVSRG